MEADIDAQTKAVKAKNTDDAELGNIYIAGGVFTVKAEQDGFHATGSIVVDDGTITVNSGDDGFHAELDTVIRGVERSLLKKATKAWKENASWSTAVTLP